MNGANLIYATACTNPILVYFDIIVPPAGLVRLQTCLWVGALVAAANWASYTLLAYGDQGGWRWDNDSGSTKRDGGSHPGADFRHVYGNIYALSNETLHATTLELMSFHAPNHISRVWHDTPLYGYSNNRLEHIGHQMYFHMDTYNVSMISDIDGHEDAIRTLGTCTPGKYCPSSSIKLVNSTTKRDSGGMWLSYNDWGANIGYDADWTNWNEFKNAAQNTGARDQLGGVQQIQPCTDEMCYGVYNKFCLSGGMSPNRGEQSAFVGETYVSAYGGVDGVCDDG